MQIKAKRREGIEPLYSRRCRSRADGLCNCSQSWRASVWSRRDAKKIRKTFATRAEAIAWRADAIGQLRRGTLRAPAQTTLQEAAEVWLNGATNGTIRTRSGESYKPSALRGYEAALRQRVLPELGGLRLSEVRRIDVQDFADRLVAAGLDASTVRNMLMPLRTIFRRALTRGEVSINPTSGLDLPVARGRRDRIAAPEEAAALLAALPVRDRVIWATAFYAGLRRGELQALRWEDLDLAAGKLRVERSYDEKASQYVEPKSSAGRRAVPLISVLRDLLVEHKLETTRSEGLVFGATQTRPFTASNVRRRAETAWRRTNMSAESVRPVLMPITLHEVVTPMPP